MKSLEQQLREANDEIRKLRTELAKTKIREALNESGLPDVSIARLEKHYANKPEQIEDAIKEERETIFKLTGKRPKPARRVQLQESPRNGLVDSYRALGMSEREAAIAAGMEHGVREVQHSAAQLTESRNKLREAAKLLGLSDKDADAFSDIHRQDGRELFS